MKRKKGFIQHHFWLKNGAGFTILEVMVALVLLAFGILAFMQVMPVALKASKRAEETTIATLLAQQKLEEWRACDKDPSTLCAGNLETTGLFPLPPPNDDKYEWELSISTISYVSDVYDSSVSVWWHADQGDPGDRERQRVVNLKTYMFDFP